MIDLTKIDRDKAYEWLVGSYDTDNSHVKLGKVFGNINEVKKSMIHMLDTDFQDVCKENESYLSPEYLDEDRGGARTVDDIDEDSPYLKCQMIFDDFTVTYSACIEDRNELVDVRDIVNVPMKRRFTQDFAGNFTEGQVVSVKVLGNDECLVDNVATMSWSEILKVTDLVED